MHFENGKGRCHLDRFCNIWQNNYLELLYISENMNLIWLDRLLKVGGNHHHGFGIWKPFECILKMGKEGAI